MLIESKIKLRERAKEHLFHIIKMLQIKITELYKIYSEQKKMEEYLRNSQQQYRMTLDSMADAIHVVDRELRIVLFNETFKRWAKALGLKTDVLGRTVFEVFPFLSKKVHLEYQRVFETGKVITTRESNRLKDRGITTETRKIPIKEKGKVVQVITVVRDITERVNVERAFKKVEQDKALILNSMLELIVYHDLSMKMIWVNKEAADSVNLSLEQLVGKYCYEIWHQRNTPCENCPVIKARDTKQPQEGEIISPDGREWFMRGYPVKDENGNVSGIVEVALDITRRKAAERKLEMVNAALLKSNERMKQLSLRDSHTGLYNYRYLEDVIEAEFHRAKRYNSSLSIIMLDIDYFKSINEAYGYRFGDLVLKQLARQFKRMVRRYDTIIRSGGEEFVILSPGASRTMVVKLARRILNAVNLYNFGNKKHTAKINLSIAVVSYPEDKLIEGKRSVKIISSGIDLINLGNKILNKVKESGGNNVYSSLDAEVKRKTVFVGKGEGVGTVKLLKSRLEKFTKQANQSLIESVVAFAKTIELKDHYTGEHVERTVQYAVEVANELFLSKEEVEHIKRAAILHDLGKIGISEAILCKQSVLTKKEFEIIKTHPQIGADILRPIHLLHDLIPSILYHHERWDGKGYPSGLRGSEIPLGARIVAIADVYQALISDRPYRKAFPKGDALMMISNGSGTQFDPKIVSVFVKILKQRW